jgi:hypothetical protein
MSWNGADDPDSWITISIALAMATVSAGFSIVGLTSVFVGAFGPVVALGVVLEAGKLRAVALIGMGRGSRRLRLVLVAAVAPLMGLNAVGAYGFLAKAHIAAAVAGETAVAVRIAAIDGRIAKQNAALADIDRHSARSTVRSTRPWRRVAPTPRWRLPMTGGITGAS